MTTFENHLEPSFSQPEEHGFMHFTTPNNYPPGSCFTYYKDQSGDVKNEMILLSQNTDDLINMTHYKFQQTHLGIPVEGMGCIEHYDEQGSLIFSNAKHGVNINSNGIAGISAETALQTLLTELGALNYNWLSEDLENKIKTHLQKWMSLFYTSLSSIRRC